MVIRKGNSETKEDAIIRFNDHYITFVSVNSPHETLSIPINRSVVVFGDIFNSNNTMEYVTVFSRDNETMVLHFKNFRAVLFWLYKFWEAVAISHLFQHKKWDPLTVFELVERDKWDVTVSMMDRCKMFYKVLGKEFQEGAGLLSLERYKNSNPQWRSNRLGVLFGKLVFPNTNNSLLKVSFAKDFVLKNTHFDNISADSDSSFNHTLKCLYDLDCESCNSWIVCNVNLLCLSVSSWYDIEYCSMLQSVAFSLLITFPIDHCYTILHGLSQTGTNQYIFCTARRTLESFEIMKELLKTNNSDVYNYWYNKGWLLCANCPNPIFEIWITFVETAFMIFPLETRCRLFDAWVLIGEPLFYCAWLALLQFRSSLWFDEDPMRVAKSIYATCTEMYHISEFFKKVVQVSVEIDLNLINGIRKKLEWDASLNCVCSFLESIRRPIYCTNDPGYSYVDLMDLDCTLNPKWISAFFEDTSTKVGLDSNHLNKSSKDAKLLERLNSRNCFMMKIATHSHRPDTIVVLPVSLSVNINDVGSILFSYQGQRFARSLYDSLSSRIKEIVNLERLSMLLVMFESIWVKTPVSIFNLISDGHSTKTLSRCFSNYCDRLKISRISESAPLKLSNIVFFRTTKNEVFGAILSHALFLNVQTRTGYFGDSTCSLFSLLAGNGTDVLKYPHKHGSIEAFISTSNDEIRIGGGHGTAIHLSSDMCKNTCHACETFENPCLLDESITSNNLLLDDLDPVLFELVDMDCIVLE